MVKPSAACMQQGTRHSPAPAFRAWGYNALSQACCSHLCLLRCQVHPFKSPIVLFALDTATNSTAAAAAAVLLLLLRVRGRLTNQE